MRQLPFPSHASLRRGTRWLTALAVLAIAYLAVPYPQLVVRYVGETCNFDGVDCPAGARLVFVGAWLALAILALATLSWILRGVAALRRRALRGRAT